MGTELKEERKKERKINLISVFSTNKLHWCKKKT